MNKGKFNLQIFFSLAFFFFFFHKKKSKIIHLIFTQPPFSRGILLKFSSIFLNERKKKKKMQEEKQNQHLFKVLVIGDYAVGKTSIIKRYCEGYFTPNYKLTIGVDFAVKVIDCDDQTRVSLQVNILFKRKIK